MKILHVISQRPDSTGSGIYLQAMLNEAFHNGHSNAVIAACDISDNITVDNILPEHIQFIRFNSEFLDYKLPGMSDVMPYPSSRFQDLTPTRLSRYEQSFLAATEEMITRFKPDVIHSHHLWLLSSLIKQSFPEVPMITSCHGSDLRQFQLCPHLRKKVLAGCRRIEKILALTENQKREIEATHELLPEKIHVVGAGFDSRIFHRRQRTAPSIPTLIYCGKLSKAKGVPWMLKALHELQAKQFHFHLVGSGSGKELTECLALAKKHGDKVTVHGSMNQGDLAALFRKSHVFVLPSLFEGLPLVILEALASGCRIVTTRLPGCLEIGNKMPKGIVSYIVLPRLHNIDTPREADESEFIRNIQMAMDTALQFQPESDLNGQRIQKSLKMYSWSHIFQQIEHHYDMLLR